VGLVERQKARHEKLLAICLLFFAHVKLFLLHLAACHSLPIILAINALFPSPKNFLVFLLQSSKIYLIARCSLPVHLVLLSALAKFSCPLNCCFPAV